MIAGIDIGGTKTHIAALEPHEELCERIIPTADWRRRLDAAADVAALLSILSILCGKPADVIVVGAHGCDTDEDCLKLQMTIASQVPATVLVVNDSELLLPAAGMARGVSLIAGTGSIAVSRNADRQMMAAGGWGWFLGDEGSASGLVREAARAVRSSVDEGEALDPLGHLLLKALGLPSPVEFGRALIELGSAARVGALAPLVFEAAESGSRIAESVIKDGGEALALLVHRLIERGATGRDVVAAGGVITSQPRLLKAFQEALACRVPDATVILLGKPPVFGALRLAKKLSEGSRPATLPLPHSAGLQEKENNGRAA